ncbi:MAG: hypothetical protein CM15mP74_06300 [Halieaceae bacterium]|nr:MAG: hypothetical protein CM15mP74_06300 [Halieaceae bacterium]
MPRGQLWDLDRGEIFDAYAYDENGAEISVVRLGPYCDQGGPRVSLAECVGGNAEGDERATPLCLTPIRPTGSRSTTQMRPPLKGRR